MANTKPQMSVSFSKVLNLQSLMQITEMVSRLFLQFYFNILLF